MRSNEKVLTSGENSKDIYDSIETKGHRKMGPSELQQLIDFEPFVPFRLTLSSGNIVEVRQRDGVNVTGLTMSIIYATVSGEPRFRLISLPNIALVEPILEGPPGQRLSEELV